MLRQLRNFLLSTTSQLYPQELWVLLFLGPEMWSLLCQIEFVKVYNISCNGSEFEDIIFYDTIVHLLCSMTVWTSS